MRCIRGESSQEGKIEGSRAEKKEKMDLKGKETVKKLHLRDVR